MQKKKRIALITTWFPPQQSVATNRMLAFTEYLSPYYEMEVFCLDMEERSAMWNDSVKAHYSASGKLLDSLKSQRGDAPVKHKLKTLLRIIIGKVIKNPLNGWQKKTTAKLIERHTEDPFDLIISSFAPQEAHIVGLNFCKAFPTVPWIADMRDAMSQNPHNQPNQKEYFLNLESEISKYARAVTSVSSPILDDFRTLCPGVSHFAEIRNGYNHSLEIADQEYNPEVFKIGYFGSFYGGRKPGLFFEALIAVKNKHTDFRFEVHLVGTHRNFPIPSELSDQVILSPALPYNEAILKMAEMHANMMMEPRSGIKGVFTGKLFDYLSVRRSVLAMVDTEDVAAQLVKETNAGYVGECTDLSENIRVVTESWLDWKNKNMKIISPENALRQHRKFQVEKLHTLINEILVP